MDIPGILQDVNNYLETHKDIFIFGASVVGAAGFRLIDYLTEGKYGVRIRRKMTTEQFEDSVGKIGGLDYKEMGKSLKNIQK